MDAASGAAATTASTPGAARARTPPPVRPARPEPTAEQVRDAHAAEAAFTKFVGSTVFGQMLGSMRKTVGEPAYFHGGQAEKVFQGQLDQAIADGLTDRGGSTFARELFERQFPHLADVLRRDSAGRAPGGPALHDLANLRRR